ncbi:MAG TPA: hypothetical protein VMT58_09015, partial [Candidatus Binataceae bacterium]|nr:hypothetical protein [Candidatus Binataceae bacterium]
MSDRSSRRSEVGWATLGAIAFAAWFGWPLLRHIGADGLPAFILSSDWDSTMQVHWIAYRTIAQFHQFPLWDPYMCGGMPMLGNPESAFLTPFLPLELLVGPLLGVRLEILFHIAIAFGGAYFLARIIGTSWLGAMVCAAAFSGSSWYYLHVEAGHLGFLSFAYLPWTVALMWTAVKRCRLFPASLGGVLMALMLTFGGLYPLIETALFVAILAVSLAFEQRRWFPIVALAVAGAAMVGVSAVKLLPTIIFSGAYPRIEPPLEVNHLQFLWSELFSRDQNPVRFLAGAVGGIWWEYGAYLGPILGGLAILGGAVRYRVAWPWIILAAALVALAAGNLGDRSPWVLLHRLPFYSSIHQPGRWLIPFTLVAGVLAGYGVDVIRSLIPHGEAIAVLLAG